jgi:uncharacterized protein (TIGR00730 family)
MTLLKSSNICVFCGSSSGASPAYAEAARQVGALIARRGLGLVYGGGRVGLMGIVADAALEAGGRVIGVIPQALATKEIAHDGLSELHVVPGMHERKALMATKSSAFLTLPGGIGTFEEFFEILTWGALGIHRKPIGVLNVEGFFDPLITLLDHGIAQRFINSDSLQSLMVSDQLESLITRLLDYVPPAAGYRWMKLPES